MSVLETFLHDPLVEWVPSVSKRVSLLCLVLQLASESPRQLIALPSLHFLAAARRST